MDLVCRKPNDHGVRARISGDMLFQNDGGWLIAPKSVSVIDSSSKVLMESSPEQQLGYFPRVSLATPNPKPVTLKLCLPVYWVLKSEYDVIEQKEEKKCQA